MYLFHISTKNLGKEKIFTPRIPSNRYEGLQVWNTYMGEMIYEDDTIPRICVSPDIARCLLAMGLPCHRVTPQIKGYVYVADKPRAVSRDLPMSLVPDAIETKEYWILSKTKMKRVGTILVDTKTLEYKWIRTDIPYFCV